MAFVDVGVRMAANDRLTGGRADRKGREGGVVSFESTMSSLPPLVIPGSLNGVFGGRVVPILESKGWTVVHSDIWETITETLDRPLRKWAVTVSVPMCGAVVELRRSGPMLEV